MLATYPNREDNTFLILPKNPTLVLGCGEDFDRFGPTWSASAARSGSSIPASPKFTPAPTIDMALLRNVAMISVKAFSRSSGHASGDVPWLTNHELSRSVSPITPVEPIPDMLATIWANWRTAACSRC